ncbi:MAG TPA: polysaccharide pyruvyl transferase family protein [Candidatus Acidoferrum sp.]|jgi:polysaccharide pyruvyl transferase WcaK-like protein
MPTTPTTTERSDSRDIPSSQSSSNPRPLSSAPVKVALLGVTFDSPNLGVGALLGGCIAAILSNYPNAQISVLDYGYDPFQRQVRFNDRDVAVDFVNLRFSKRLFLPNNIAWLIALSIFLRLIPVKSLRERIIAKNSTLKFISETDVFGSIAGGDSFADIYGLSRLFYVGLPQILIILLGKKLVLFPQTFGPFKGSFARRIARYIISHSESVYLRDKKSIDDARKLLPASQTSKVKFCFDVGFLLKPEPKQNYDSSWIAAAKAQSRPLVGINVSGLLYSGGYTGKNEFGLKADYRLLVEKMIEFFIREKSASVALVSHVQSEKNSAGPGEGDDTVCREIFNSLESKYPGQIFFAGADFASAQVKHVIAQCDFFTGSRMHACIAALSQAVPAVAISYSDKFVGVLETIGMTEAVADPRKLDENQILQIIGEAFDHRESSRRHLLTVIPEVQTKAIATLGDAISPYLHPLRRS